MNRHVEVIRFERISHLPESTQGIISVRLFKAKRLVRFAAFLRQKMKRRVWETDLVQSISHLSPQYGDETQFLKQ